MKKLFDNITTIVFILGFAAVVALLWYLKFHLWCLKHPGAPVWTYFF